MGTNRIYLNGNAFYSAKEPSKFDPPDYLIKGNDSSSNYLIRICTIDFAGTATPALPVFFGEIKLFHKMKGTATLEFRHCPENIGLEGEDDNVNTLTCKTGFYSDPYYVSHDHYETKDSNNSITIHDSYIIYGLKTVSDDYFKILETNFNDKYYPNSISFSWADALDGVVTAVASATQGNGYYKANDLRNRIFCASPDGVSTRTTTINHIKDIGKYAPKASMLLEQASSAITDNSKPESKEGFVHTYFWDSNGGYDPQVFIANAASNKDIGIYYQGMSNKVYEGWKQVARKPIYEGSRTSGRLYFADLDYQIVWCEYTFNDLIATQWGSLYTNASSFNMNWPYPFSEEPMCYTSFVNTNGVSGWLGHSNHATATKTQSTFICHANSQGTNKRVFYVRWVGIGKCAQ